MALKSTINKTLALDGHSLTLADVEAVARYRQPVELAEKAKVQLKKSRAFVEQLLQEKAVVYGVTTGFGKFKDVYIPPGDAVKLQRNYLLSHSAGVGAPFDAETVRAIALLRANSLAKGYSGIRLEVVQLLINLLNHAIEPVVPEQGSVGASGDLAPLSHLAAVLIGEGEAFVDGEKMTGKAALAAKKLAPVELEAKEALALTNGTQVMSAIGTLVVLEGEYLAKLADVIGAMSLEALLGSRKAFSEELHSVRPHPGQVLTAANLRKILQGSEIIESHANCSRVQDAYSLRCMPQVHGAARQALIHARGVLEIEVNSATDNPLVFDDKVLSGGNFHGQPLSLVMDYVACALSTLANISERRIERLVNPSLSDGLPAFLTTRGGLHSGFMLAQYTAAALASENKSLAHPASVDSITTSANLEDINSMGPIACRKARMILANLRKVLAIELLCAAQALDLRTGKNCDEHVPSSCSQTFGLRAGVGVAQAHQFLRQHISHMDKDRQLSLDIDKAEALIRSGEILTAVEKSTGKLS